MKTHTKIHYATILILAIFAFISSPHLSQATVGGPTFIYNFKYNPADESVYYTEQDQSGRGCPPILLKMSLNTGKVDTVFSCDAGEALSNTGGNYSYDQSISKVNQRISEITNGFKELTPINLRKNNIAIDVDFVRSEKMSPEEDWIIKSHFTAKAYQNNVKISEFPIGGCNLEQPFTFAGYAIPGFEKKIILLLSTKSNCWEGGYTGESLHVIAGVSGLDKTYAGDYKGASALVPNEATLVIFEGDAVIAMSTDPLSTDGEAIESDKTQTYSPLLLGLTIVIALVFGIILGRYMFKKKG